MEIKSIKNCASPIWNRFRSLHPNSPEKTPVYTEENIKRWLYHIEEAKKNDGFEKVIRDMADIESIRKQRRVNSFDDFKDTDAAMYMAIARCYPVHQVYACGSRVRGDWFSEHTEKFIVDARKKAGMQTRRYSDYDFYVEPDAVQCHPLPTGADRCRVVINPEDKIEIPLM